LSEDLRLATIREGVTELLVPEDHASNGPSSSDMPVFYNPKMEFSRDMSVVVLGSLLKDGDSFLDGLAASGARGIRVKKESGVDIQLHLNDGNPLAVDLAGRNLSLNGITGAVTTRQDLRTLLLTTRHNCIDVDPFGTPAPFISMAVGAVRNNGILCATATDTGTISGIFSAACKRRYSCEARRAPFYHEIGVRNLLGFIAREAAKQDVGIHPIVAYYADHYVRTFMRLERGAGRADDSLANLGYCSFDKSTLERGFQEDCERGVMGPIWIAPTCDVQSLSEIKIRPHLKFADKIAGLLSQLKEEAAIGKPHFTMDELSRMSGTDNPKMEFLLERLRANGEKATRTHFGPKTFRTDASVKEIIAAMR